TKVKKIADTNNWHKELFLSYNNIGLNYYLMLDYGEALKQYLIAHKISIEKLEPEDEIIVLNNIAILYYKEKDYKVAESYFKKAFDIAKKTNNEKNIPFYAAKVASIAAATGDAEKAEEYLNISLKYLKKLDKDYNVAKNVIAKILWLQGQNKDAINLCLRNLPKLNDPENQPAKIGFLKLLSEIYLEEKQFDKAVYYAESIAKDSYASINEKLISYQYLATI